MYLYWLVSQVCWDNYSYTYIAMYLCIRTYSLIAFPDKQTRLAV